MVAWTSPPAPLGAPEAHRQNKCCHCFTGRWRGSRVLCGSRMSGENYHYCQAAEVSRLGVPCQSNTGGRAESHHPSFPLRITEAKASSYTAPAPTRCDLPASHPDAAGQLPGHIPDTCRDPPRPPGFPRHCPELPPCRVWLSCWTNLRKSDRTSCRRLSKRGSDAQDGD